MNASHYWAAMVGMTLGALEVYLVPSSAIAIMVAMASIAGLLYALALWSRRP